MQYERDRYVRRRAAKRAAQAAHMKELWSIVALLFAVAVLALLLVLMAGALLWHLVG